MFQDLRLDHLCRLENMHRVVGSEAGVVGWDLNAKDSLVSLEFLAYFSGNRKSPGLWKRLVIQLDQIHGKSGSPDLLCRKTRWRDEGFYSSLV